jgi:hypothetical protein
LFAPPLVEGLQINDFFLRLETRIKD